MFGAGFVAMNHEVENLRGLWYKLSTMGVPIEGPSYIYGDNMSIIYNNLIPESVLKNESNIISYHLVREYMEENECPTSKVTTLKNLFNISTKVLYGQNLRNLVKGLLRAFMTMNGTTEIGFSFVGLTKCLQADSYGITT